MNIVEFKLKIWQGPQPVGSTVKFRFSQYGTGSHWKAWQVKDHLEAGSLDEVR